VELAQEYLFPTSTTLGEVVPSFGQQAVELERPTSKKKDTPLYRKRHTHFEFVPIQAAIFLGFISGIQVAQKRATRERKLSRS